jgi:hypothetical protein
VSVFEEEDAQLSTLRDRSALLVHVVTLVITDLTGSSPKKKPSPQKSRTAYEKSVAQQKRAADGTAGVRTADLVPPTDGGVRHPIGWLRRSDGYFGLCRRQT